MLPAHEEILSIQLVTNNKYARQVRSCAAGFTIANTYALGLNIGKLVVVTGLDSCGSKLNTDTRFTACTIFRSFKRYVQGKSVVNDEAKRGIKRLGILS
jgi:hypothetical protein